MTSTAGSPGTPGTPGPTGAPDHDTHRVRVLTAFALLVLLVVVLMAAGCGAPRPGAAVPARVPSLVQAATADGSTPASGPGSRALALLRRWDERREQAWRAGDPEALEGLYRAGSRAGRRDVRRLRRWRDAGWRVESLGTQVLSVQVLRARPRRCLLRVVERLSGATARPVAGGSVVRLPSGRPSVRQVSLRREAVGWRVSSVRGR